MTIDSRGERRRYKWKICERSSINDVDGDLYHSNVSTEMPPLSASSWETDTSGSDPPPSLRALDGLHNPILPGWIPLETHPAQVAVATYVATPVAVAEAIAVGQPA